MGVLACRIGDVRFVANIAWILRGVFRVVMVVEHDSSVFVIFLKNKKNTDVPFFLL